MNVQQPEWILDVGRYLQFFFIFHSDSSDGDKMVPSVEKKMDELEMGLLHLQQNIDIPEITLMVHPTVATVIKRCQDEGRKPKVADFGDKVNDSSFLNQLQNQVNRWIKEIQKVTFLFGFQLKYIISLFTHNVTLGIL